MPWLSLLLEIFSCNSGFTQRSAERRGAIEFTESGPNVQRRSFRHKTWVKQGRDYNKVDNSLS